MRLILSALALWASVAGQARSQDARIPDPGPLHDTRFVAPLDATCGFGRNLSEGCAAIRARTVVDAAAPPWSAIGRVNFASIQVAQHCTGTLVAESWVLTASHCLYNYPRKSWIPPSSITFAAGYQRGGSVASARGVRYVLDPVQDSASRDFRALPGQDWALVELDAPIGAVAGVLPLADAATEAPPPILAGYPALRPHVLSLAEDCGVMAFDAGWGVIVGHCSAMSGDSGAPLLVQTGGRWAVSGVFSGLATGPDGAVQSVSVPVSRPAQDLARLLRE